MSSRLRIGALALGALAAAAPVAGQGIAIGPQSACLSGRVDAGVALPCGDGSTVFYNPAGTAVMPGALSVGGSAILSSNHFIYDSTGVTARRPTQTALVPNAYAMARLARGRLGFGLAVNAPFGLSLSWPLSFEGRFAGYDNSLHSIFVQPTAAWQVVPGRLAVGAGLDAIFTSVSIEQRLDLADQVAAVINGAPVTFAQLGVPSGTDFGDVTLAGHATSLAGNFGILARPTDRISLGLRYETATTVKVKNGTAVFRQVPTNLTLPPNNPFQLPAGTPVDELLASQFKGPLADQALATSIALPAVLVAGLGFEAANGLHLAGDYTWTGWSRLEKVALDFQTAPDEDLVFDWRNTGTWRVGADYAATAALALRAGFSYNDAAEGPGGVSPLLPEGPRNEYTVGFGYDVAPGFTVDAYYLLLLQADRRGRLRVRTLVDAVPPDRGVFTSTGNLFGLSLTWHPGGAR